MPTFQHHLFVCCNERECGHPRGCCEAGGGSKIRDALRAAIAERGLKAEIRINQAGCLDQCEYGPTLVVYPQGTWYGQVRPEDAPRIADALQAGTILEDLRIPEEALNTKGRHPWQRG